MASETIEAAEGTQHRKPGAVLFVAAFAAFLATFNETFLNVGFSPIMDDLHIDMPTVQWLATAYMLGAAVMVPVSAFAYRSVRTRQLFCATAALLVIGSVIGGLAQSFPVLLVGRIVQALGTGMLIPIGMNITLAVAPRQKLGTYMGIMGAMTTLGPSSSVILAGLILAVADWHMLLWVFAGLSALCLLVGAVVLRDVAKLTHPALDAGSVALASVALIGIPYGISTIFSGSLALACVTAAVGIIALVLFVRRQGKIAEPLINLKPLSIAPFTIGVIANMIALLVIFAMNIIVPTFMQSVLGIEPLVASLTLFPAILCSCVVSPLAGRLYDKHGPGTLLPVGFLCIALFSVLTAAFIATASPAVLALLYIPVICGSALVIGPVQSFALSRLSPEMNPHGVTVMSTGFQVAGCIGSSVFTGIYTAASAGFVAPGVAESASYAQGMLITGIVIGAVGLVGFGLALWIRHTVRSASARKTRSASQGAAAEAAVVDGEGASSAHGILSAIMKTDVYTLSADATIAQALQLFAEKGISGVPVVDGSGAVTGFISDGDVMSSLANQVPAFKSAWSFVVEHGNADFDRTIEQVLSTKVLDVMTRRVICVNLNDDMGAVAQVLSSHHLKKAPVLSDGKMVGVINRSNITGYAVRHYLDESATR